MWILGIRVEKSQPGGTRPPWSPEEQNREREPGFFVSSFCVAFSFSDFAQITFGGAYRRVWCGVARSVADYHQALLSTFFFRKVYW